MPRPFALPDLGEGLTEAEIVKVLVNEGDVLAEDAPLLEVETDKATVEIPSPFAGRVARIHVRPGQSVKVGEVLVTFDDAAAGGGAARGAARFGTPLAGEPSRRPAPTPRKPIEPPSQRTSGGDGGRTAVAAAAQQAGPVPATPATRRLARELGIDLRAVRGTGPGGRVTDDDVRGFGGTNRAGGPTAIAVGEPEHATAAKPLAAVGVEPPPLPRFEQWGQVERQPLSHLRRTIAERMTLSATLIPHVTHFDRADITELDAIIRRNVESARER